MIQGILKMCKTTFLKSIIQEVGEYVRPMGWEHIV